MSNRTNFLNSLRRETDAAKVLLSAFADILGEDLDARRDAVEGETRLHEAVEAGLARVAAIAALQSGIATMMESLKGRLKRLTEQDAKLRVALYSAMEVANLQRLETPLGTISTRAVPPSVVVVDEALIPEQYWQVPAPVIDKAALKEALKAGPVAGAQLSNGGATVAIRLS